MRSSRIALAALAVTLLAACGGGEAEKPAEPAANPIEERVAPTRDAAKEAEKAMQDNEAAMNAQVEEAMNGAGADTTKR